MTSLQDKIARRRKALRWLAASDADPAAVLWDKPPSKRLCMLMLREGLVERVGCPFAHRWRITSIGDVLIKPKPKRPSMPAVRVRASAAERAECVRRYSMGTALKVLEQDFGCTASTISRWVRKAGTKRGHLNRRQETAPCDH
jgi:hypothetical protein